jgi:lysophospholipase L1-like esterase
LQKPLRPDKKVFLAGGGHFMRPSCHAKLVLGVLVLLPLDHVKAQHHSDENFHKRPLLRAQAQAPAQSQAASPDPSELSRLQSELQHAQDKLKDWPNLARYRDANSQVPPPASAEGRVLFMGDSITDGWGRKYGKFFPGKPYINRGISGQTTPQMLIRFRPDVIALQPAAVVILAGTNDIAGNTGPATLEAIESNLMSMAELAHANGIRVVLASLLPVSDYIKPQTPRRPTEKILALNAWMKDYAAKNEFIYLDYYSAMLDENRMLKQELTYDGLHPNDAGYEVMAPLAEKAIAAALYRPPPDAPGKSPAKRSQKPAT